MVGLLSTERLYMVFDVESIGLHGEGFAVGWYVIDRSGERLDYGSHACDPNLAKGEHEGRVWIADNVPNLSLTCDDPVEVRRRFWVAWRYWQDKGAVLVADCAWPVEARFLINCVDDDFAERMWQGPYPLHELASFMVAAGFDPMATYDRLPDEPQHNPLGDAKQSARLLLMALKKLRGESRDESS